VRRLTLEAADLARASVGEARQVLAQARRSHSRTPGISRAGQARAIASLAQAINLGERVVEQTRMRFAGQKITDRLVSLHDPDARPVRRGKLAKPGEFGYVVQLTEVTTNPRRGARGLLLPPNWRPAPPTRTPCCPPPPPNWTSWRSRCGRPPWTPASSGPAPNRPWPVRELPRCLSPATPATPDPGGPAGAGPASGRLRGQDLPPQAQLRGRPDQAQGHPRRQDLGELVGAGLRPGHPGPAAAPPQQRLTPPEPQPPPEPTRRPTNRPASRTVTFDAPPPPRARRLSRGSS
jgi:IS5 family transposase